MGKIFFRKRSFILLVVITLWLVIGIPIKHIENNYDGWIISDVKSEGYLEKGTVRINGIFFHRLFQGKKFIGATEYNFNREIENLSLSNYYGQDCIEWIYENADLFGWSIYENYIGKTLIFGKRNNYNYILPVSFSENQMIVFGNYELEAIKKLINNNLNK